MAKKKDDNKGLKPLNMKSINKTLSFIQQGMNDLHRDTYASNSTNDIDLEKVSSDIEDTINNIVTIGNNNDAISNISKLFSNNKIVGDLDSESFKDDIKKIIGDDITNNNIIKEFMEDKTIQERDRQIDLLCTYMPKLEDVIQTKVDNILSADHFTKEFINITNMNNVDDKTINSKVNILKKRYNLTEKIDSWVYDTCKYGEKYIYIVPYKKAISRLMNIRKNKASSFISESAIDVDYTISDYENNTIEPLKLEIDTSSIIEEVVTDYTVLDKLDNVDYDKSLHESYITEKTDSTNKSDSLTISDKINNAKLKLPTEISNDGLVTTKEFTNENDIKVNGAIVRELDRSRIKAMYLDDTCLGYYYVTLGVNTRMTNTFTSISSIYNNKGLLGSNKSKVDHNDVVINELIKKISDKISEKIDAKFVNNNADLRNEIYLLLKYSCDNGIEFNNVRVTYIPPDDIVHLYFKKDPITHRGISDLEKSIIPATLYCTLYLSDTLGILTRGQDKRVFYVKQTVDTNISANLMNVINQVKKSNFNVRSLNNLYNVLNVLGRYNDFFIPLSKGGDSPVQIETMQGQNIDIKQDLYDLLESLSLSPTDVSREMLEARNSLDYAIQQTMSNSKFLRKMLKRQATISPKLSLALSMIYTYHFGNVVSLEVTLPAPQILNINNLNQMIAANEEYTQKIIDTEYADADDALKNIIKKNISRYNLSTHIPYAIIDKIIESSKVEYEVTKNSDENEE